MGPGLGLGMIEGHPPPLLLHLHTPLTIVGELPARVTVHVTGSPWLTASLNRSSSVFALLNCHTIRNSSVCPSVKTCSHVSCASGTQSVHTYGVVRLQLPPRPNGSASAQAEADVIAHREPPDIGGGQNMERGGGGEGDGGGGLAKLVPGGGSECDGGGGGGVESGGVVGRDGTCQI